jgi:WhiB family redox-sensing transcriptional regulator
MDWMRDALCRRKNADLWYPPLESSSPNEYYTLAKLACHRCPVWSECLELGKSETWGMWGGLTPQERRGTVKLQCGTVEAYRKGCRCAPCREANVRIANRADLSLLPDQGAEFDVKSLLFTLIEG